MVYGVGCMGGGYSFAALIAYKLYTITLRSRGRVL